MTMYAIEAKHKSRPRNHKWETIAKFDNFDAANAYVVRHQDDGGIQLRVSMVRDYQSLRYVVLGAGHRVSFAYYAEAAAYDAMIKNYRATKQVKPQEAGKNLGT